MALIEALEAAGHALKKKTAKEYATQCPKCGGVDRFCLFVETNKFWCRQCNIKGDEIQYYRDFHGMTFKQAAEAAGQGHKIKKTSSNVVSIKKEPSEQKPKPSKKKIIATYDYHGTDNNLIYQVVRFEPKEFVQRRPGKAKKWVWDMKNTPRVIYRLPDVMEEECVFFVEGEKDADNLFNLGLQQPLRRAAAKPSISCKKITKYYMP